MMGRNTVYRWVYIIAVAFLLVACGTPKPKAKEVKVVEPEPPLEVPPDLLKPEVDQAMSVPEVANQPKKEAFVIQAGDVKIARDGSLRWLVVDHDADMLWPRLNNFWRSEGFAVAWQDIKLGILETVWKDDGKTGLKSGSTNIVAQRDRYRVRLERGSNPGSSEIYLTQRSQYQSTQDDKLIWIPMRSDPEKEAEMLHKLLLYLGLKENQAKALLNDNYEFHLSLSASQLSVAPVGSTPRARLRAELALDRSGYLVKNIKESAITFQPKDQSQDYVLRVEPDRKGARITVHNQKGKKITGPSALNVLKSIKANWI